MKDLIQYPIDGILDLHVFHPRDVVEVTKEYLRVCHERGIYRVRIIHGKGRSVLRRRIHKLLAVHPPGLFVAECSGFEWDGEPWW